MDLLTFYMLIFLFNNQHNAAKALCPATVQLLKKAFVNCHDELQVVATILQCKIVMVHTLLDTRPDQVSTIEKSECIPNSLKNHTIIET